MSSDCEEEASLVDEENEEEESEDFVPYCVRLQRLLNKDVSTTLSRKHTLSCPKLYIFKHSINHIVLVQKS